MDQTLAAIEVHLSRERYAATVEAWVSGDADAGAVAVAEAALDAAILRSERTRPVVVGSFYQTNGGR